MIVPIDHYHMRQSPTPKTRPSTPIARMTGMEIGRIAWLTTVTACLVTAAILLVEGYYGYAGVTIAVALSAFINLL